MTRSVTRTMELSCLALVWLACAACDATKAVHIDDAAHLMIAEHVARDPLHPMSGVVFWNEHPAPIHTLNQPHLFVYLLALSRALSGGSLLGPHLLVLAFTALAIACFHHLATRVTASRAVALGLVALVFVGPGLLPSQNLMADVPLLSLGLLALVLFDAPAGEATPRARILGAGVVLGLACLVKYTALAWLPLVPIAARVHGDRRWLAALAPPIAMLGAYAIFNLFDYGGVHLLERHPGSAGEHAWPVAIGITLGRAALFVVTLGAISMHVLALVPRTPSRALAIGALLAAVLAAGAQVLARVGPIEMRGEPIAMSVLRALFFVAGAAALHHALVAEQEAPSPLQSMLRAQLVLTALFVVVLAPFVAVRHALLVLPAAVLLAAPALGRAPRALAGAAVASAVIGLLVALTDVQHAAAYRELAARWRDISVRPDTPVSHDDRHAFYAGHWGWQWYAERAGLEPYDPGVSHLAAGDLIIRPRLPDPPPPSPADAERCPLARSEAIAAAPTAILRPTTDRGGFYAVWQGLPWTLVVPSEPLEIVDVHVCR